MLRRPVRHRRLGASGPGILSESAAFRIAAAMALLAAVSYGVARVSEPAAGLALGLGILGATPLAAAAIIWRRHGMKVAGESPALLAVSLVLVEIGAIVAITTVFDHRLPGVAWAGFAVVAFVAVALVAGVLAMAVRDDEERHEQAFRERAVGGDDRHRVVLVADAVPAPEAVRRLGVTVRSTDGEMVVVVPALNSPIRHWTSDEDRARARAESVLDAVLGELRAAGVDANGRVGPDDPLEAIDDVLRVFPANEILLATSSPGERNWSEQRLVERARTAYALPIAQLPTA